MMLKLVEAKGAIEICVDRVRGRARQEGTVHIKGEGKKEETERIATARKVMHT